MLALGSVTGRSLEANTIYAGNPAQLVKKRREYVDIVSPTAKNE